LLDLEAGLPRLGYGGFRAGQREAIEALLEAGRLLLVAPTGGGSGEGVDQAFEPS
jgi:ATP-dependent DNA helicase RecQ